VGRSVLVTGGNRGIGLAIATAFAAQGDQVAVTHRSPADGLPGELFPVPCDVTNVDAVDAAFTAVEEKHGPVQVLVSNAGITDDGLLMRMSESSFTTVVDANLTAAYRVAKRATRGMLKARGGRMIFVSSVVGLLGSAGQVNYAASKSGLFGMTQSMAREVARKGITVNCVAPGYIETEMVAAVPEKVLEKIVSGIPVGRLGQAHEIARAVQFLVDDDAGYITGSVVSVNGGMDM
jgi:3-oxoacyl-[acyl-carrier protein] reductase